MESETLQRLTDEGVDVLNEHEAREVIKEYGVPCPEERMLDYGPDKTGEDYLAELGSGGPGYPAYVKAVSRDLSSKTDAGAVERVTSDVDFVEAVDAIMRNVEEYDTGAELDGLLVSEEVSGDTRELIVGSTVDPTFGNVLSLGVGGIYVEAYGDVEFRSVPVDGDDVLDMADELQGKKILGEFRGMDPVDTEALVDAVLKVSKMIQENPEIREMDINPLLAGPEGVAAVDSVMAL